MLPVLRRFAVGSSDARTGTEGKGAQGGRATQGGAAARSQRAPARRGGTRLRRSASAECRGVVAEKDRHCTNGFFAQEAISRGRSRGQQKGSTARVLDTFQRRRAEHVGLDGKVGRTAEAGSESQKARACTHPLGTATEAVPDWPKRCGEEGERGEPEPWWEVQGVWKHCIATRKEKHPARAKRRSTENIGKSYKQDTAARVEKVPGPACKRRACPRASRDPWGTSGKHVRSHARNPFLL